MSNLGFHCHDLDIVEDTIIGNGLRRGEFYNLPLDELHRLKNLIEHYKLDWSIHTPLIQLDWYPQPPTWSFLCDEDKDKQDLTIKMITLTAQHAEELGAEYIVVHFPSPGSDTDCDDKHVDIARRSCDRLADISVKRKISIHVEGVGASSLINAEFLTTVLKEFSPLRYCFDTAHTNLAALEHEFDLYELYRELLPYLGSMHLWNTRGRDDYLAYRHVPVHPSQSTEDGWVDIPRLLKELNNSRSTLPIIYESEPSYPEELGGYDYKEGVNWIKELLET